MLDYISEYLWVIIGEWTKTCTTGTNRHRFGSYTRYYHIVVYAYTHSHSIILIIDHCVYHSTAICTAGANEAAWLERAVNYPTGGSTKQYLIIKLYLYGIIIPIARQDGAKLPSRIITWGKSPPPNKMHLLVTLCARRCWQWVPLNRRRQKHQRWWRHG